MCKYRIVLKIFIPPIESYTLPQRGKYIKLKAAKLNLLKNSNNVMNHHYTQVQGSILTCICLNIPQVTPKWGVNFPPKTAKNGNFCQNRLLGPKIPP